MTVTELQRIVCRLSNQTWCRHWLNYGDRHENVLMAIQCVGIDGASEKVPELIRLGFIEDSFNVYTVPRTNDDGSAFVSNLF